MFPTQWTLTKMVTFRALVIELPPELFLGRAVGQVKNKKRKKIKKEKEKGVEITPVTI